MPTATSTLTKAPPSKKLKASSPPHASGSTTVATLRSLYNRAARGFLHREVLLVHSLLESAFALLHPPAAVQNPDELAPHRSKWDILRITLETTVYTSPPVEGLPDSLCDLLNQPSRAHIMSAYQRSLALFTPSGAPQKASFIPSAVILTLVYSSLKVEAPDAGRVIVEDWLASRHYSLSSAASADEESVNYGKVIDAYCLYILPKLEQWEYAKEFLDYESELPSSTRESFKSSLEAQYAQAIAARLPPTPVPARTPLSPSLSSPRPYSPTPSTSSSSSLSSTASMHTVVPATPRARSKLASQSTASRASSSPASTTTATPRTRPSSLPLAASPPRSHHLPPRLYPPGSARAAAPPSIYALLKASLAPYLPPHAKLSVISFVSFVLLLVLSLLVRRRRRNAKAAAEIPGGNAELVRRRLLAASAASGGGAGILGRMLAAAVRVVGDTVRMGGSGLV